MGSGKADACTEEVVLLGTAVVEVANEALCIWREFGWCCLRQFVLWKNLAHISHLEGRHLVLKSRLQREQELAEESWMFSLELEAEEDSMIAVFIDLIAKFFAFACFLNRTSKKLLRNQRAALVLFGITALP